MSRPVERRRVACEGCGKIFATRHPTKRFHVARCREARDRERAKVARDRYVARHPERVRASCAKWRKKPGSAARVRRLNRRWRRRNRGRHLAILARRYPKLTKKRKTPTGRVCRSCARTDRQTIWSNVQSLCGACDVRGRRQGFCPRCKGARYGPKAAVTRGRCRCPAEQRDAARGRLRQHDSPLRGAERVAVPLLATALLSLEDAIRWRADREATGRVFAGFCGLSERQVAPRRFRALGRALRRLDPGFETTHAEHDGATVFRWTARLVEGLGRWAETFAVASGDASDQEGDDGGGEDGVDAGDGRGAPALPRAAAP